MSHQQNHLVKTRKNIFDQSIAQLLAELDFARSSLEATIIALRSDFDKEQLILALSHRLRELDQMKANRG